jgi:hypothetical protein
VAPPVWGSNILKLHQLVWNGGNIHPKFETGDPITLLMYDPPFHQACFRFFMSFEDYGWSYISSVIAQTRRSICSTTTTRKILGDLLRYTPLPRNSNTSDVEIALYPMYLELDWHEVWHPRWHFDFLSLLSQLGVSPWCIPSVMVTTMIFKMRLWYSCCVWNISHKGCNFLLRG